MSHHDFVALNRAPIILSLYEGPIMPSAPEPALASVWYDQRRFGAPEINQDDTIKLKAYPTGMKGLCGGMYELAELPGALLKVPQHMTALRCESL